MSVALRTARFPRLPSLVRCLATASGPTSRSTFSETLATGPSFGQFVSGKEKERVVLGNTNG
jgi:lipoic acid synthetase